MGVKPVNNRLTFRGGCLGCVKTKYQFKSSNVQEHGWNAIQYDSEKNPIPVRKYGCNIGVKSSADYKMSEQRGLLV